MDCIEKANIALLVCPHSIPWSDFMNKYVINQSSCKSQTSVTGKKVNFLRNLQICQIFKGYFHGVFGMISGSQCIGTTFKKQKTKYFLKSHPLLKTYFLERHTLHFLKKYFLKSFLNLAPKTWKVFQGICKFVQ